VRENCGKIIDMVRSKTLIILPIYGAWDYVFECLKSVEQNTLNEHYDIFIQHNRNDLEDGEIEKKTGLDIRIIVEQFLRKTFNLDEIDITYSYSTKNLGVAKSWNAGLQYGMNSNANHYDSFLMLNSDVVVFESWLSWMRLILYNSEPTPYCIQTELTEGNIPDISQIRSIVKSVDPDNALKVGAGINGPCFMITRVGVSEIGIFDEQFEIGFYEDTDILMRIRLHHQEPIISAKSYVHHHHAKSRSSMKNFKNIAATNKRQFESKWSVCLPGSFDSKSFPKLKELQDKFGYSI